MKNLKLLLVEDNEGDIVLAKEAVASINTGISFKILSDAREAWEYIKNLSSNHDDLLPDAVLLDINLPGINGKELLTIIKSDPRTANIPVIIFSSNSSFKEIQEVYQLKANWYATKPDKLKDYKRLFLNIERLLKGSVKCSSLEMFTIT